MLLGVLDKKNMKKNEDQIVLVSSGSNGDVTIWDASSQKKLKTVKKSHRSRIYAVCISTDCKYVFTAGTNAIMKQWELVGNDLVFYKDWPSDCHTDVIHRM